MNPLKSQPDLNQIGNINPDHLGVPLRIEAGEAIGNQRKALFANSGKTVSANAIHVLFDTKKRASGHRTMAGHKAGGRLVLSTSLSHKSQGGDVIDR